MVGVLLVVYRFLPGDLKGGGDHLIGRGVGETRGGDGSGDGGGGVLGLL